MKKSVLLLSLFLCLFIVGCGSKNEIINNEEVVENIDIFSGEFTVAGVGPVITFEPEVQEGTLVLKRTFEDHSDHVFILSGMRENALSNESDYLPGNKFKFEGKVEFLDGAAGNHYYVVDGVDNLEILSYPDLNEISQLFDSYNFCESDSDCGNINGECPLGCNIPININFVDIGEKLVSNYNKDIISDDCIYDCSNEDKVICKNYKCVLDSLDN